MEKTAKRWLFGTLAIGLAATAGAQAPEPSSEELTRQLRAEGARLNELYRSLDETQRQLDSQRRQLEAQRARIDALLQQLTGRGVPTDGAMAQAPASPAPAQPGQPAPGTAAKPVGEAPRQPDQPSSTAQIFEEPTTLTPRGKFVLEPAYQFVHSTDNRVALVGFSVIPAITIGLIDVRRVSRDINTFWLTGRYGVTNRFEVEAKVPWVWSSSSTLTRPLATPSITDQFFDASGSGIGDVELAGRYQLNQFRGDNAVWIAYLRYKFNTGEGVFDVPIDPATGLQTQLATGSGFPGIQPGFTVLYPSDPAVFFGGASYLYSFERDVGNGYGTVRPGGVLDFNLGMGLALNERSSFSIGYQHSIVGETSQRDPTDVARVLAQTGNLQLGTLRFGLAYRLSQKLNMNLSLGVGVTDDTPDFEATVRFPYSF
jgi:hypothetical protein